MANTIKIKQSSVASKVPLAGDLVQGELAINTTDQKVYSKDATTIFEVKGNSADKLPLAGGALTGAVTTTSTFDGVDIATRDGVLTSTTTTANAALPKAGGALTGAVTTTSTFDGRDVATDGTKLDGIATGATANGTVTGSGTTSGTNTGDNPGVTSVATSGSITGGTITGTGTISHLTTAGNKHIPAGGSANQVLTYSADGTAVWADAAAGGHTITINQATTTWLWTNPTGWQNQTVNLTNYPFYPRVQVNSKGTFNNTSSAFVSPVAGSHASSKSADPGYPSTTYNNAIGIKGSFGTDHTRKGWGRVSYQYMTFA